MEPKFETEGRPAADPAADAKYAYVTRGELLGIVQRLAVESSQSIDHFNPKRADDLLRAARLIMEAAGHVDATPRY